MTDTAAPTEGARWRGYSHKDLYAMLHDGPGAAASAEPSRRWGEIAATLTEIGQDLQKALDSTGSGWAGRAAGTAYERLSTTVAWAAEAGTGAATMRTSVEDQAEHIAKARADMPKPEDVPATAPDPAAAPAVQVLQTQADAEPAEAAASSAEERAVEVMTTYETNTNATTAALATFETPQKLLPSTGMHQNQGGGLLGLVATVPSGLLGLGGGAHHADHHHADHHRNSHHGNNHNHRDNWHSPSTSGSSSNWDEPRRAQPATAAPGPGKVMGSSSEPLLAPRATGARDQERPASRSGSSSGGSNSGTPGAGPRSGAGNMALPPGQELQQQAAAASQAAATAHSGAGAPLAPAAGPVGGGGQDKMALRRFGMDAIGSSQWFGDNEEPVAGQSPKRRFDLRESAEVTEPVSILDEEHQVPPNVIGDGGR